MVQPYAVEVAHVQGPTLPIEGRVHGEKRLDGDMVGLADAQTGVAVPDLVPLDAVGRQRRQHGLRRRGLESGGGRTCGHGDDEREEFVAQLHREVDMSEMV